MTVTEFIDEIVQFEDNVAPTDASNTENRARILAVLQRRFNALWFRRPWAWTIATDSVSLSGVSGQVEQMPSDFHSVPVNGGVYLDRTGERLKEVSAQDVQLLQMDPGYRPFEPEVFSVFMKETNGIKTIQGPICTQDTPLTVFYKKVPPTLVDGAGTTDDVLNVLPVEYHETVLIPDVMAWVARSKGSSNWREYQQTAQEALAQMMRDERTRQSSTYQIPSFFDGWR